MPISTRRFPISSRSALKAWQQDWARQTGRVFDHRGYVGTVDANLWRPLLETTRRKFEAGSGSELKAKMLALHSSSALAVNFFEYWTSEDSGLLARALGLSDPIVSIEFEAQYPTVLRGTPPNLDVVIKVGSGQAARTIAVESKFCEWLSPKPAGKVPFKSSYFPASSGLWHDLGLPECQRLASDLQSHRAHFRYLDAPQLLRHALGLATPRPQCSPQFNLYYIYFDWSGPEREKHRAEINDFAHRVGDELRFKVFTYQELFTTLTALGANLQRDYVAYLRDRYFSAV